MKTRLLVSVGIAIVLLSVMSVSAFAAEGPWTGEPDPFGCNFVFNIFRSNGPNIHWWGCYYTVTVCIEGVTHEVGFWSDPSDFDERGFGKYESHFNLTFGACPEKGYPVGVPTMRLYTGSFTAGFHTCSIVSDDPVSAERLRAICGSLPDDINQPCAGPVYRDGTKFGLWECDWILQSYGETRLPLYGEQDAWDLLDVHDRHLGNQSDG